MSLRAPTLVRETHGGVAFHHDPDLARRGVVVAFTERTGGVSAAPFASLNLAGHVGDDPTCVAENRRVILDVLGIPGTDGRLAEVRQVHGADVVEITGLPETGDLMSADGICTGVSGLPLLVCCADCVPIALISTEPRPLVAVIHAGWRGALAGIPGVGVRMLTDLGAAPGSIRAYIGPHIGPCCYEVSENLLSQFSSAFDTLAPTDGTHLDLGRVVSASLAEAGVHWDDQCRVAACTAHATDRFFSHRAEAGLTGRHGVIVAIL